MDVEITVPKLSATMEEATVLAWHKAPGDAVAEGEVIVELETDKAALEVEATVGGILRERCAEQGASLRVGAPLARIGTAGATSPGPMPVPAAAPAVAPRLEALTGGLPDLPGGQAGASGPMPALRRPSTAPAPAVRASPLARRIARDRGISLGQLRGSGPAGRILRRDVEAAAAAPQPPARAAVPASPGARPAAPGQAASRMRQAIAAQVSHSRATIPAFAIDRWVDLGLAEDTRAAFNARGGPAPRLTLTDMLLQALADVLPAHPVLLSRWQAGDPPQIVTAPDVAIGLAVALDDGLMIPVLDGLGGLGLDDIAQRRAAAVARARSGRAGEDAAATLTLSNIGAAGADRFEAIINPGEAAILAVGRLREAVVATRGAIRVARGATLTLSVDHRLIDGRTGAAFMAALAQRLEGGGWRA